ncbi:MAG: serine/threonine-protein kinase [Gemmatimonadota bacterium]
MTRPMNPVPWQDLKRIFHAASQLPPGGRAEFLDRECGREGELRGEVESLLAHLDMLEAQGGFLDHSVVDLAAEMTAHDDLSPGSLLGPWRIVEELGRGGMGSVYLARRDDRRFEQEVAVKVVKRGMDTREVLRRFRREQHLLARMNHPGIARIYDAGSTPDGRPYVVMERVEGVPITHFCRTERLALDRRLDLFVEVCQAVAHAHENLILHRDLKPAHIVVDPGGTPRLLDFGIAGMLTSQEEGEEEATREDVRYLTPGHASPEQLRGEPLGTASDEYALGVILYQLLTGRHPFQELLDSPARLREAVLTRQAPPPSNCPLGPEGTDPGTPRGELRGDLDAIVLKTLRPGPEDRYGSVPGLMSDVRRFRAHLPVTARGDARLYRARKFMRRNGLGVVAGTVIVVGLSGTAAAFSAQSARVAAERDKAQQVTELLLDLIRGGDPLGPGGDSLTVRQVLDRGAQQLESDLATQPEVRLELEEALAQAYFHLGLFDAAEARAARAVDLARTHLSPRDPVFPRVLNQLAVILDQRGQYDEAEAYLTEALERIQERPGMLTAASDAELLEATVRNNLGRLLLVARGNPAAAEPLLTEALETRRRLLPPPNLELAASLHNLALVRQLRGELAQAVEPYRESLAMRIELLGPRHPQTSPSINNLALVLHGLGRYDEAEPLLRESLDARMEALGETHPTVAVARANLGMLLRDRGELDEAEAHLRRALEVTRVSFGTQHARTAAVESNLADLLREKGESADAESLYQHSLTSRLATLGPRHPHVAYSLTGLGQLRMGQGDADGADSLLTSALALRREVLPGGHPDLALTLVPLAQLRAAQGSNEVAAEMAREAWEIRLAALGPDHPRTLAAREVVQELAPESIR